jgi:hypothetical protein
MSNREQYIVYSLIAVAFFVFGILFFKGCLMPKEKVLTSHTVIEYLPAPIINDSQTHTYQTNKVIPLPNESANQAIPLLFPEFTFKDSIQGEKDSIKYRVIHISEFRKDSVKSVFHVEIEPYIKHIIDSIYVKTTIEINKPYYKDIWFYAAITEGIVVVVVLVKTLWMLLKK